MLYIKLLPKSSEYDYEYVKLQLRVGDKTYCNDFSINSFESHGRNAELHAQECLFRNIKEMCRNFGEDIFNKLSRISIMDLMNGENRHRQIGIEVTNSTDATVRIEPEGIDTSMPSFPVIDTNIDISNGQDRTIFSNSFGEFYAVTADTIRTAMSVPQDMTLENFEETVRQLHCAGIDPTETINSAFRGNVTVSEEECYDRKVAKLQRLLGRHLSESIVVEHIITGQRTPITLNELARRDSRHYKVLTPDGWLFIGRSLDEENECEEKAMELLKKQIGDVNYNALRHKGYFTFLGKYGLYYFHKRENDGVELQQDVTIGPKTRTIKWELCVNSVITNMPLGDIILSKYLECKNNEDNFIKTANFRKVTTKDEYVRQP